MKTIFVKNYEEMSDIALEMVQSVIGNERNPVISMTTGGSPRGLFERLLKVINNGELDISTTTFMNLDEYIGPEDAIYTVHTFMYQNFYNKLQFQPKKIYLIDGATAHPQKEIIRYTNILNENPRDIQILGLGTNGHIGANEPGTPFDSTLFLAQHDESTIQSTVREYGISLDAAPTEMITLGFTEILSAKQVILLVSGKRKAHAVKAMLEGSITPACPASYLRDKENVVMIVDEDAASELSTK